MTGISTKTRRLIADRDKGRCLRCGQHGTNVQHRIGRGMGGSKRAAVNGDLAALVTMCGSATTGCHGWATSHPKDAEAAGWVVRRSTRELPSEIPLTDLYGRQFFLLEDGEICYVNDVVGLYPSNPSDYTTPF